ncbi:MAG: TatD family hydrolase [Actinomycetota bacterium]|nr:TatD family hydrolase [Actinomycetota bacterium]
MATSEGPPRAADQEGQPLPAACWLDSHCHLQDQYRSSESGQSAQSSIAGVLGRALEAGVGTVVCVGTDAPTSAQALAIAAEVAGGTLLGEQVPAVWATAGLHPHQASSGVDDVVRLVDTARAAGDSSLVAVGECGLDYHYDHSPRPEQRRAFGEQVALARRTDLALVIHVREAWDDLFDVLGAEGVPERTVLHCFTGGPQEARRCLDAGMYISFSGIVTFKNADEIREAASLCPIDRVLVETDSPFLAPVPHRGRPNEPAFVPLVGAAVAQARGADPIELADASRANAERVFARAAS